MRRSTRLSVKRTNFTPDTSDEDEPKKSKSEPKINSKGKSSRKKPNQPNSGTEESTGIISQRKASNIDKLPNKKPEKDETPNGSSSESDIENYLQPADQIDLSSTFFRVAQLEEKGSFEAIENNIFADINRLSDSESEYEDQTNPVASAKKTKIKAPKPLPVINFQHVQDYSKKLEEAKKSVERYEANKEKEKQKMSAKVDNQDISNLLALGETKLDSSTELQPSVHSSDYESFSESGKEDWEEVEERDVKETLIPKEDLQITVELPTVMRQKRGKDLVASMKRRLNRIRKENQVLVHKVHLLCWIGHGNYLNDILNNECVLALILSLIPAQHSSQSGHTDLNRLETTLNWYISTMPNIEKRASKDLTLDKLLKLQIIRKEAFNKKMLVYMFVCLLRSLGIQCRLVLSFRVAALRPPASELHSLSAKISDKKDLNEKTEDARNSKNAEINNAVENKTRKSEEETEPRQKPEKHTVTDKKSKKNENEDEVVKENKRTRNTKKNPRSDVVTEKSDERKTRKAKKEINKTPEKAENSQASSSKQKNPTEGNSKKKNRKSLESEVKPKTRSQSAREEESQKAASNQLVTKVPSRSKSTSQLDSEKNNATNTSQKKKRKPLSLKNRNNIPSRIPQIDGADDSDDEPKKPQKTKKGKLNNSEEEENPKTTKKPSRRHKSLPDYTEVNSDDDFKPQRPKRSANNNSKLKSSENTKSKEKTAEHLSVIKRRSQNRHDDDSDYTPQLTKRKQNESDDEFHESTTIKGKRVKAKKDADIVEPTPKKGFDVWVEVYLEAEKRWISVDVVKGQVQCPRELHSRASHPITYIVAWNNDNSIKDVTQRYCPKWNTVTRKLRIDKQWWDDAINPFEGQRTSCCKKEDEELAQMQLEKPLPTTIHEYKNHPLYVLKRHLLKFEALYPPEPVTLGFVRKEAVYSRDCVHKLHTRETWFKQAKVVKPGEEPYRILKTLKWDKIKRQILKDQPLEVFGIWQIEDYVPPTAQNGIVPRNEYGNVELFQSCMLPKGTTHLQLPGLNKLARRMNIDCAPAMVGFDFHSGWTHPVFDGYVVCEEHSESLIAAWYMEQEEQEKRELEKIEKRVYGNWKKLIKGLLIRERLKARYNFGVPSQAETATKKRTSKGPKFVSKKHRLCGQNESDSEDD